MGIETHLATVDEAHHVAGMAVAMKQEISRRLGVEGFELEMALQPCQQLCERMMQEGRYLALLACLDGDPVGFAGVSEDHAIYAGGRLGTLRELYVKPGWRWRGVGAALIAATQELARQRSWFRIETCTPPLPEFERSMRFLGRKGYEETGWRKLRLLL